MRRILSILLAIVLICVLPINVLANEEDSKPRLSEASDEEIQDFLSEYGIAFPSVERNYEYWRDFILMAISKVEQDPDYEFAISYTEAYAFANAIKAAVNDYYGLDSMYGISTADNYTLVNSVQYIDWSDDYMYYNCYAYAIGLYYSLNPGDIGPGSLSSLNVGSVAELVVGDLEALDYQCVQNLTYWPSSIPSGAKLICLRTGPVDYHFMKFSGSSWYHKPARTLPLRWRYTSPAAAIWTNERITYEGGEYVHNRPTTEYNSSIRYFVYKQDHSCTTSYGGENYHSGNQHYYKVLNTCVHCGDTFYTWDVLDCNGPPCIDYSPYAHDDFELVEE